MRTESIVLLIIGIGTLVELPAQEKPPVAFMPKVPKTWDDAAMATLEVPLADPVGSPKHAPAEYYYRVPVRHIYKQYPVYAPGREPAGYTAWLEQQDPAVIWDDRGHAPPLKTEADWIEAGEIVFDSPINLGVQTALTSTEVRDPSWYRETGTPVAKDGTVPFARYVIRKKGNVEIGAVSCGTCHTRVMPDGSILKGAQGSFPFDRSLAFSYRSGVAGSKDPVQALKDVRWKIKKAA